MTSSTMSSSMGDTFARNLSTSIVETLTFVVSKNFHLPVDVIQSMKGDLRTAKTLGLVSVDGAKLSNGDSTVSDACLNKCCYRTPKQGKFCSQPAFQNGYCQKHQRLAVMVDAAIGGAKRKAVTKLKPVTVTEQRILAAMNTVRPSIVTKVRHTPLGLMDPISEVVFEPETYRVLGVRSLTKHSECLKKLSPAEVELCEVHGWEYTDDVVEDPSALHDTS